MSVNEKALQATIFAYTFISISMISHLQKTIFINTILLTLDEFVRPIILVVV